MKLVGKSIDHRGHREHRGESQRNHKSDLNAESAEERRVEHDLFPPCVTPRPLRSNLQFKTLCVSSVLSVTSVVKK